ncbi:MAG: hypothetical protein JWO02_3213 [Solirubrobacterales bacterium]|nr:hypothetical protein [Solirubrobacterales bacterium]
MSAARPLRRCTPIALVIVAISAPGPAPARAANVTVACSNAALISAITNANAAAGADVLTLPAGCTYTLTTPDNYWYGPNGLPPIASDITIEGNGAVIERSNAGGTTPFRLFYVGADPANANTLNYVSPGAGKLTLRALTLRGAHAKGGDASGGGGGAGMGGAIFNQGAVVLERVTASGNYASGGNIVGYHASPGGGMGANAADGGGFGGGFVAPAGAGGGGAGSASASGGGAGFLVGQNGASAVGAAPGVGGGPANGMGGKGAWTLGAAGGSGSGGGTQSEGAGGAGGGFGKNGVFPPNGAGIGDMFGGGAGGVGGGGSHGGFSGYGGGGGFGGGGGGGSGYYGSPLFLQTGYGGGGGFGGGGGAGGNPDTSPARSGAGGWGGGDGATIYARFWDQELAVGGGGAGLGGVIFNDQGTVTVVNSTLANNLAFGGKVVDANVPGNPGAGRGAAIFNLSGSVVLKDSTIASTPNGFYDEPKDHAVYSLVYDAAKARQASVTIERVLFSGGVSTTELTADKPATVSGGLPNLGTSTLASIGSNHAGRVDVIGGATSTGTWTQRKAQLGPLADNGGPGQTMMPQEGEASIDAATGCSGIDQRGVARPFGSGCDLGAVEVRRLGATTGDATAVTQTSATLNASMTNPLPSGVTVRFEYGRTDAYGSLTPLQPVAANGTGVAIAAPITQLTPGFTYHYRVAGVASEGANHGADRTFTALGDPGGFPLVPFGPSVSGPGGVPVHLEHPDLNGDGRPDLVVLGSDATSMINTGQGFGPQVALGWGACARFTQFAQVTGGPALDAVTPNCDNLTVRPGNGDGTFGPAQNQAMAGGYGDAALGDVDGDGDLDVMVASWNDGKVRVGINTGGAFVFSEVPGAPGSIGLALQDDDGDGDLDLYLSASSVHVLTNDGRGVFHLAASADLKGAAGFLLVVRDFDGRNGPDVVARAGRQVSVLLRNADGTFGVPVTQEIGDGPGLYADEFDAGDVDDDGDLDLAVPGRSLVSKPSDGLWLLINDGTGTMTPSQVAGDAVTGVTFARLDGDRFDDLAFTNSRTNLGVTVLRQRTSTVLAPPATATASEEAGLVTLTLTRSDANRADASVGYSITGGSAGDADREPVSGRATFAPGALTTEVLVPLSGDTIDEPDETFTLTWSNPRGGAVLDPPAATTTVTLTDDDASAPPVGPGGDVKPPPTVTIPPALSRTITVASALRQSTLRRGLTVRVRCSAACAGTIRLRALGRMLGQAKFKLTAAGTRTVRVRISKANLARLRQALRKRSSVAATVETRFTGPAPTVKKKLKIKR